MPEYASTMICPECEYDLRATKQDPDGRFGCPECGIKWRKTDLLRQYGTRHLEADNISRFWSYGIVIPPLVAPLVLIGLFLLRVPEGVAIATFLLGLAMYSIIQSAATTSPQPLWVAQVAIRSMALFMMISMLSIVASGLFCIPFALIQFMVN